MDEGRDVLTISVSALASEKQMVRDYVRSGGVARVWDVRTGEVVFWITREPPAGLNLADDTHLLAAATQRFWKRRKANLAGGGRLPCRDAGGRFRRERAAANGSMEVSP